MARSVWPYLLSGVALISLSGCGWIGRAQRPAWRTQAENYCVERGFVKPSAFVEPVAEIDGPGICGLTHPFKVSALFDGRIPLNKPLILDCPMIPTLEAWVEDAVQPAAQARFGAGIAELDAFGSYSCRSVDNIAGAQLSEHAFGNAIDISGFKLTDGREINIVRDWKKAGTEEANFLREAHAGACSKFTTILGPGADVFHYNHFHLDLAMHGSTNTGPRRICRPAPPPELAPPRYKPDGLPPAPDIEEPLDVSKAQPRTPMPRFAASSSDGTGLEVGLPPALELHANRSYAPVLPEETEVDATPTSSIRPRSGR